MSVDPVPTPPAGRPAATWDPAQYLRHSGHRARPFVDLLARVPEPAAASGPAGTPFRIADLGCGPGNVTALLADRWPTARITGVDSSREMLDRADAAYAGPTAGGGRLDFVHADLTTWDPHPPTAQPPTAPDATGPHQPGPSPTGPSPTGAVGQEPWDLLVSNATLQWVPGHLDLFPRWLAALRPGGTLAFQVPGNFDAPSHLALRAVCDGPRWADRLGGLAARAGRVADPAEYLERLADLGCSVDAWETTYCQVLTGPDPVLDWVKGTALRPALTALSEDPAAREEFLTDCREELRKAYPAGRLGTVFPFRRVFVVARKED
ncbi:methyltransferase domain-containing protein [Streptomyces sp. BI20]|uniref:methyltransferase domain-containing protein n=1 Tax=Streptomyces sp. BI20 TaxID=3403460 RepID=UPI003C77EAD7